ncbi:MAG: hypothetical protein HY893_04870 [Deltaproteobacteria bacterium]|nr:hypothetical protein [Deltaproteobacteria bacterium]
MIVYRKAESTATTRGCMSRLLALLRRFDEGAFCHGDAVEALIEWGEFASGVMDAVCPQEDTRNDMTRALDEAGVIAGHILRSSWEKVERGGDGDGPMKWASMLRDAIQGLFRFDLPGDITLREPEGFAHYGLYPETYLEAARRFFAENRPKRAACIGLRSIGVSLSSVVAAVLEDRGCAVSPFTLRPREHPFNRRVILSSGLASELPVTRADYYLIVDEGPGLSGTSLSSVADCLSSLGIPDERIVIFPSWEPDGANFFSESARRRWQRHRKYTGSFGDIWVKSGRLADLAGVSAPIDVSAGFWRGRFFEDSSDYPAVDPYHEKRKYLFDDGSGGERLLRFAGLGRYGRIKLSRAGRLSGAGFVQKVHGLKNGFLDVGFEQGRPVTKGSIRPELLDRMGEYLAFIRNNLPARKDMAFDELYGMAERNTLLGLGQEWAGRLSPLRGFRKIVEDSPPSEVDGRMLPHEWIDTGHGYIKADGFDHYSDQFFPCAQDIAWDVAGAFVEFGLDGSSSARLMGRYISLTGDKDVAARLPFYSLAYLAYRLGYCTFAEREMRATPDGPRFKALLEGYGLMLKSEILKLSA